MKIIVEKDEANEIKFELNKKYLVLKEFSNVFPLGYATISVDNGIMYADITLKESFSGYPAVGYAIRGTEKQLQTIGLCSIPNLDKSIDVIKYTKQLDGKPNNLKTK